MKRWRANGIFCLVITLLCAATAGAYVQRESWWSAAFMTLLTAVFSRSVVSNFIFAGRGES